MNLWSSRFWNFKSSDEDYFIFTLGKHFPSLQSRWEIDGIAPRHVYQEAAEAGMLCPDAPREFGGAGGTFLDQAIVVEEQ